MKENSISKIIVNIIISVCMIYLLTGHIKYYDNDVKHVYDDMKIFSKSELKGLNKYLEEVSKELNTNVVLVLCGDEYEDLDIEEIYENTAEKDTNKGVFLTIFKIDSEKYWFEYNSFRKGYKISDEEIAYFEKTFDRSFIYESTYNAFKDSYETLVELHEDKPNKINFNQIFIMQFIVLINIANIMVRIKNKKNKKNVNIGNEDIKHNTNDEITQCRFCGENFSGSKCPKCGAINY